MSRLPPKKIPNPDGNPLFKTDQHPAKLRQEADEPANSTVAYRVPAELKEELQKIPNREIREWLWELVKARKVENKEPEPVQSSAQTKQQGKSQQSKKR